MNYYFATISTGVTKIHYTTQQLSIVIHALLQLLSHAHCTLVGDRILRLWPAGQAGCTFESPSTKILYLKIGDIKIADSILLFMDQCAKSISQSDFESYKKLKSIFGPLTIQINTVMRFLIKYLFLYNNMILIIQQLS